MDEEDNINYFKDKLYQTFQDTGMLDNVKAQLRYKLIEKLQKTAPITGDKAVDQRSTLTKRVMASIVSDYLEKMKFTYSTNVFLPESGFSSLKLNRTEMLEIMQLRNRLAIENENTPILESIVDMFCGKSGIQPPKTNSTTQTETCDAIMNLEAKLGQVDVQYKQRFEKEAMPGYQQLEERFAKFKREYEMRMKAEMAAEITRVREFEIANVRMEEAEKFRLQMQEYREELEKNHMEKLNKLREREKSTLEKCSQRMKELESYNHGHRQQMMKDFELLKLREDEVQKQQILNEEMLKVEKMKLENLEKELRNKIKEVEDQKLQLERKISNDIAFAKLQAHQEMQDEKVEIMEKKKILMEDMLKIDQLKESLNTFTVQNKQLTEENSKLVNNLHEVKQKRKEVELDNVQLRENLRTLSESQRRDLDQVKSVDMKFKLKEEEVTLLKETLKEKEYILEQYQSNNVNQLKKFNLDVQTYQEKIESLENQIRKLKSELLLQEEQIKVKQDTITGDVYQRNILQDSTQLSINKDSNDNIQQLLGKLQQQRQQMNKLQEKTYNDKSFKFEIDQNKYRINFDNQLDNRGSQQSDQQELTTQQTRQEELNNKQTFKKPNVQRNLIEEAYAEEENYEQYQQQYKKDQYDFDFAQDQLKTQQHNRQIDEFRESKPQSQKPPVQQQQQLFFEDQPKQLKQPEMYSQPKDKLEQNNPYQKRKDPKQQAQIPEQSALQKEKDDPLIPTYSFKKDQQYKQTIPSDQNIQERNEQGTSQQIKSPLQFPSFSESPYHKEKEDQSFPFQKKEEQALPFQKKDESKILAPIESHKTKKEQDQKFQGQLKDLSKSKKQEEFEFKPFKAEKQEQNKNLESKSSFEIKDDPLPIKDNNKKKEQPTQKKEEKFGESDEYANEPFEEIVEDFQEIGEDILPI